MNKSYYKIRNKFLANSLSWITGQSYYVIDDKDDSNNKAYSFEQTDKLMEALTIMNDTKRKFNEGR